MPRVSGRNVGGSLAFNGSSTTVVIPSITAYNATSFSVYGFVNPARPHGSVGSNMVAYRSNIFSTSNAGWYIRFFGTAGNTLNFGTYSPTETQQNSLALPDGKWSFFVCTYDLATTTMKTYINGSLQATTVTGVYVPQTSGNLIIASSSFRGKESTIGYVNKALSQTEVNSLFYNTIKPTTNLIGLWNLDEMTGATATDTSGNGNNGTITAGVWSLDRPFANRKAIINQQASFASSENNKASVGSVFNSSINSSQAYTLTTMVKKFKNNFSPSFGFMGDINGDKFWFNYNQFTDVIRIYHSDLSPADNTSSITVKDFAWHRLTATFASNVSKIYLDGQLVSQRTLTGTLNLTGNDFCIFGSIFPITGLQCRSAVWNRALTEDEVRNNYLNEVYPSNGLLGQYIGNEGAGVTVYDVSGNARHATAQLATWSSDTPSKARKIVGGNMIANGDMSYIPAVNVATTINQRWVDGTSTGSTANSSYKIGGGLAGTASVMFDTTNLSPLGSPSLKLSTLAVSSYVDYYSDWQASTMRENTIPVLPNTSYTVSYYMKTNYISGDSANGARMVLFQRAGDLTGLTSTTPIEIKTTTGWTKYTDVFTTGATVRSVSWAPRVYGHTGAGTLIMDAWFANITLTPTVNITRTPII